jgi:3-hydroxyisobutyrate dehydrogenase
MTGAGRNRMVAVLGAGGTMGFGMARNLLKHGIRVRAWNRTLEKAEPLAAAGAELSATPGEAAQGADTILTMLSDADAVMAAMNGRDGAVATGGESLWLQMSTIGEDGTARCAELADARGLRFVDAPVLGTKQPAEEGALVVLASGPDELRDAAQRSSTRSGSAPCGSATQAPARCSSWS